MKNLMYFVMGLVLLPLVWMVRGIIYIRDYGKDIVLEHQVNKRLRNQLRKES